MFHKVKTVKALPEMELLITFTDDTNKKYDVKPLLDKWPAFQQLSLPGLFNNVQVDAGGYGISWNDDIDLSAEELWHNGITCEEAS